MSKNILLNICLVFFILFLVPAFWIPEKMLGWTTELTGIILSVFDQFYLWLGLGCVVFCVIVALSPIGKKRLGKDTDRPKYSTWSWVAMLFSAGMGAGLIQRACQEPVQYFMYPPLSEEHIVDQGTMALQYSFFHWGFSPWAIYAVFGLIIAWIHFRQEKAALTSSTLPIIGEKKTGKLLIDTLAVIVTIIGLTASVGFGSGQISGGINHLLGQDNGLGLQIIIVIILSILAFISAMAGLDKGIKVISQLNLGGTLILMFVFLFFNDLLTLFSNIGGSLWAYVRDFIPMSLALGKYGENTQFVADWTIFYWAFWLAWAPFTGLFIARISKGRTIRSFLAGVLIFPSLGTFLWFSVFGFSAFDLIEAMPSGYDGSFDDLFTATYKYFEHFPLSTFVSIITVILCGTWLITSLDSAIYVTSIMSDGGVDNPAKRHKITWGIMIPLVAIGSLLIGGDTILRSMSNLLIIMALPFAFIMSAMMVVFLFNIKKQT